MDSEQLTAAISLLRTHGTDTSEIEAKAAARGLGESVWESVSAFANTRGGTIILGVDESTGFTPSPGFDPEKISNQFITGAAESSAGSGGRFTNPPSTRISSMVFEEAPVLVIEVEPNEIGSRPCFITKRGMQNGSYKRVGDGDHRLSAHEVFELKNELLPQNSDRMAVEASSVADLDPRLVDELLAHPRTQRAQAQSDDLETRLLRLNAITAERFATLAGILTLGKYPQQFAPRLVIDVTAHPGLDKSDPLAEHRFLDREICEGTIPEMVDRAIAVVRRNLRTHSVVTGAGRADHLEIPEDALREAVSNAVVHREYDPRFHSLDVSIDIFSDRVTVTSPGGLWGGITLDSLADGRSQPRNPTLLNMLQATPSSSGHLAAEGAGSGILLMINKMKVASLQPPEFTAGPASVTVTFRRHGAEVPALRSWLNDLADRPFTSEEDAILLTLKEQGAMSVPDLHDRLRYDSAEISTVLANLRREGIVAEPERGQFAISSGAPLPNAAGSAVISRLSKTHAMDVHEISEAIDRSVGYTRRTLRQLIEDGWVVATAPPTSRDRKYLRAD